MVMMAARPGFTPQGPSMPAPMAPGMGQKATTGTPQPGGMATPQPYRPPMGGMGGWGNQTGIPAGVRPVGGAQAPMAPGPSAATAPQMQIANALRNMPPPTAPGTSTQLNPGTGMNATAGMDTSKVGMPTPNNPVWLNAPRGPGINPNGSMNNANALFMNGMGAPSSH